jgi:hypothetical protein
MPLTEFNVQSLADLDDGRVSIAFAQELRRAVIDCMDRPGDKNARKVRQIKFRRHESGYSNNQHGNESLGQSVEEEVTGADALPESLVVETNLYSNPGLDQEKSQIGLDLEIDTANRRFFLRPIPDEIEKVTAAQLEQIRAAIIANLGAEMPVFFGHP